MLSETSGQSTRSETNIEYSIEERDVAVGAEKGVDADRASVDAEWTAVDVRALAALGVHKKQRPCKGAHQEALPRD